LADGPLPQVERTDLARQTQFLAGQLDSTERRLQQVGAREYAYSRLPKQVDSDQCPKKVVAKGVVRLRPTPPNVRIRATSYSSAIRANIFVSDKETEFTTFPRARGGRIISARAQLRPKTRFLYSRQIYIL
jgi:hypothetical protein